MVIRNSTLTGKALFKKECLLLYPLGNAHRRPAELKGSVIQKRLIYFPLYPQSLPRRSLWRRRACLAVAFSEAPARPTRLWQALNPNWFRMSVSGCLLVLSFLFRSIPKSAIHILNLRYLRVPVSLCLRVRFSPRHRAYLAVIPPCGT